MSEIYNWEEAGDFGPNLEAALTSDEVADIIPDGLSQRLAYLYDAVPSRALLVLSTLSDASICILEEHGIIPSSSPVKPIKELINEAEANKDFGTVARVEAAVQDIEDDEDSRPLVWTNVGCGVLIACAQRWSHLNYWNQAH